MRTAILLALSLLLIGGCKRASTATESRPNILIVVWDTVRADRLGVYGHTRPTTPRLDAWARGARVFDNVVSPGSTTVPSHASLFTGLLPSEHGADNEHARLDSTFDTLAERLSAQGYATYCFSANPFISATGNFTQGFDLAEHPWDAKHAEAATRIVREKIDPGDRTGELADKVRNPQAALSAWNIKTAGALTQPSLLEWLNTLDRQRPYFAFLNYMEAHRPLIPARRYREMMMTPEQTQASYTVDRSWRTTWAYTFGLKNRRGEELLSEQDIELTNLTYDAALRELDDMLADLLAALEATGRLKNTIVVLTSDHGELLGEHHMLDHQFSVHEELLRVPLIVHYPPAFPAGRDARPVMTQDLFPTLLELAGVTPANMPATGAVSLQKPLEERPRLAEYPSANQDALRDVQRAPLFRDFDPTPWNRGLRAYYSGQWKFIHATDGRHELYNLTADPRELDNRIQSDPEVARRLEAELAQTQRQLLERRAREAPNEMSAEQRRMLESLGYLGTQDEEPGDELESKPASQPAPASSPQIDP